jgi:hypothetical protein
LIEQDLIFCYDSCIPNTILCQLIAPTPLFEKPSDGVNPGRNAAFTGITHENGKTHFASFAESVPCCPVISSTATGASRLA